MDNRNIRNRIIFLAIPTVIAQVINTIYSIVDRIFIGKLPGIGTSALSGIGTCYPVLIAISAFAQLIGVGGSTMMSIYMGDEERAKAEKVMGNVIALTMIVSAFLFFFYNFSNIKYFFSSEQVKIMLNMQFGI